MKMQFEHKHYPRIRLTGKAGHPFSSTHSGGFSQFYRNPFTCRAAAAMASAFSSAAAFPLSFCAEPPPHPVILRVAVKRSRRIHAAGGFCDYGHYAPFAQNDGVARRHAFWKWERLKTRGRGVARITVP
ncbi:MAG: hypothetical protein LBU45_02270 [Azoarcus sp.]|jgi:hypothetical protein|nr:hypothetical protein [Azoarcus sp.]